MEATVCFTNLAVGVPYCRNGIGEILCQAIEKLFSKESSGYNRIYLKVEIEIV